MPDLVIALAFAHGNAAGLAEPAFDLAGVIRHLRGTAWRTIPRDDAEREIVTVCRQGVVGFQQLGDEGSQLLEQRLERIGLGAN